MGDPRYRILGPVEVEWSGGMIPIAAPRQLAVLAVLLIEANRVVSTERLIGQLWGDRSPASARNTVQSLVLRLRRALARGYGSLGTTTLITRNPGYLIRIRADQLDLHRFEQLSAEGQTELRSGHFQQASATLAEALAVWRGNPFENAAAVRLHEVEACRLRERRLQVLEDRIHADLLLGRHEDLTVELPALIAEHRLREPLYEQLMLALYRSRRQADALLLYQQLRRRLSDELGVEPTPTAQQLYQRILTHDPLLTDGPSWSGQRLGRREPAGAHGWVEAG